MNIINTTKISSATVEGTTVKVGDCVGFKSDFEQTGEIIEINRVEYRGVVLTLRNPNGFGGEYLRHAKTTKVRAEDCWI